jgi:hypothetical protein
VKWRRPSEEQRREHQETLELLAKLVLTQRVALIQQRSFVLLSIC